MFDSIDYSDNKPFRISGKWLVKPLSQSEYSGVLEYCPESGHTLALVGEFGLGHIVDDVLAIQGILVDGTQVTLFNAFRQQTRYGKPGEAIFRSNAAIVGGRFNSIRETSFCAFSCRVEGLTSWLGSSPTKLVQPKTGGFNLECPLLQTPETSGGFVAATNAYVSIAGGLRLIGGEGSYSSTIAYTPSIDFSCKQNIGLEEALRTARNVNVLFFFLLGRPTANQVLTVSDNNFKDLTVLAPTWYGKSKYEHWLPITKLSNYSSFHELYGRWLEVYEKFRPAIDLLWSTSHGAHGLLQGKFLALAQALEAYSTLNFECTLMEKKDFKHVCETLKKNIPQNIPVDADKRIREGLSHLNVPTLRERLRKLLNSIDSEFRAKLIGTDMEEFISYSKKLRDSLSHPQALDYSIFDDTKKLIDNYTALYRVLFYLVHNQLGTCKSLIESQIFNVWPT